MCLFEEDDQGYINWYRNNPNGFVLNYLRPMTTEQPMVAPVEKGRQYPMLHKASCNTITGTPAMGKEWTYIWGKRCSNDKIELLAWTLRTFGREPAFCGLCKPRKPGKGQIKQTYR
jgi:hypothetical protein